MALTESSVIDIGSAANVLLLAPTMNAATTSGCGSLLASKSPPGDALLSILTVESPKEMLHTWQDHVADEPPVSAAFLLLGGNDQPDEYGFENEHRVVHPIKNPSNLTDIGVAASTYLSRWQTQERSISCCFRSITTLLQYVENRVVYRFLHQFAQQMTAVGGVAHYHMDPSAHDQAEVNTLLTLFDAVVELDEDDSWQVRSRTVG